MKENILIKGKFIERKILGAYCFGIPAVLFVFTLMVGSYVGSSDFVETYIIPDAGEGAAVLFYLTVIALGTGIVLWYYLGQRDITVTDKRVYGKAAFGVMIDLPFDKIASVSTSFPKAVAVATSSGLIKFFLLENQQEIFSTISELLIKRQSQSTETNNNVSNADELQKYKILLDNGVITQEEFDAKKKQILNL